MQYFIEVTEEIVYRVPVEASAPGLARMAAEEILLDADSVTRDGWVSAVTDRYVGDVVA